MAFHNSLLLPTAPFGKVSQSKLLVLSTDNHTDVVLSIHVNRTVRQMKGNIGENTGKATVSF